jgi:hypothetical protein
MFRSVRCPANFFCEILHFAKPTRQQFLATLIHFLAFYNFVSYRPLSFALLPQWRAAATGADEVPLPLPPHLLGRLGLLVPLLLRRLRTLLLHRPLQPQPQPQLECLMPSWNASWKAYRTNVWLVLWAPASTSYLRSVLTTSSCHVSRY